MLSVLVCTYNRAALLAACLDALLACDPPPGEVVVVNGGSTDVDAVVRAATARARCPVVLVNTTNVNLAASRNVGLAHCRGTVVALTDDDAEVAPDWVGQHLRLHAELPQAGAIGGAVVSAPGGHPLINALADLVTFPQHNGQRRDVRNIAGVNASYKRAVLDVIGPQDETLFRGEDVDFNWRVVQAGWRVVYDPAPRVLHHHRPTLGAFLMQHHMYGRAYVLVRRKWPSMYAVYPRRVAGLRDVLKVGYFVVSTLTVPARTSLRLPTWRQRLAGFGVLVLNDVAWKLGMVVQAWAVWRGVRRGHA